jgi:hypothetical protein
VQGHGRAFWPLPQLKVDLPTEVEFMNNHNSQVPYHNEEELSNTTDDEE